MDSQTQNPSPPNEAFTLDKHIAYLLMMLKTTSEKLARHECNKIFNLYFILTGLDILDSLDKIDINEQHIIDFIYNQQCSDETGQNKQSFGFLGGPYLGFTKNEEDPKAHKGNQENIHYSGNLVYTFPALCTLVMLGDNLSRVNKKAIMDGIKLLQLENGCFLSTLTSNDYDLRFTYAACAISFLLNDWSGINVEKAVEFILACQNYDYAYGFCPEHESHAAATFLAVASLKLMGKEDLISNKGQIIAWCLSRQYGGFQGRINKLTDSCYSFWVCGTLQILGYDSFIDQEELLQFLLVCQTPIGGLSKFPEDMPDPVHTLHSLFGLSMTKKLPLLKKAVALLNITDDTYKKWENLENKES